MILMHLVACSATSPQPTPQVDDTPEPVLEDSAQPVDSEEPTDTGQPSDTATADFEPDQGTWTVQSSQLTEDGCSLEDAVNRGEPGATLVLDGPQPTGWFTMIFSGGGELVDCELNGRKYSCTPTQEVDSTALDMGLDAAIPVEIETVGVFGGETSMTMNTRVLVDCEGKDCDLVALLLGTSFPCTMGMESDLVTP